MLNIIDLESRFWQSKKLVKKTFFTREIEEDKKTISFVLQMKVKKAMMHKFLLRKIRNHRFFFVIVQIWFCNHLLAFCNTYF